MKKHFGVFLICITYSLSVQAGNCLAGNCYSGTGTFHFDSGGKYSGEFRNGKMHGRGEYVSQRGTRYYGDWFYGRRQGKGKMYFSNGDVYSGSFKADRLEGYGKITYTNGDYYLGDWKNNKAHGQGKYVFEDSDKYTGSFVAGKFHGKGQMKYKNGSVYTGYWADNKKNGLGSFVSAGGRKKEGNWSSGKFQEQQTNNYVQTTSENARQQTQATGSHQNTITKPRSNRSYTVKQGAYTFSDGTEYIGEMINGLPNGSGKVFFFNGDRYEGGWEHYAQNGLGKMIYANGRVITGKWERGKLIRKDSDSHQSILDANERYGDVKVWAVLVGISSYSSMPTLKYTDDDAYRMYAFLKSPEGGAVPDDQISVLIDQAANKNKIINTIKEVFSKADPNDVVFFYYSGHGLSKAFVPVDFDGYNNLLYFKDVVAALDQSQAKNKICIADACYAGGLDNIKSGERYPQTKFYDAFKKSNPGTALFLSSREEEFSLEDHGLRSGIFSHYLIKAMKGEADFNGNGIVTIQEAFDYVGKRVENYTQKRQTPILTGNFDPSIPLSSLR